MPLGFPLDAFYRRRFLPLISKSCRHLNCAYAILESTFFGHQPLPSASHLRMDGFACEVAARCNNFCRHFRVVLGVVVQHVTHGVTARTLVSFPEVVTRYIGPFTTLDPSHIATRSRRM